MKTNRQSNNQQAGFTLVELMVTMVVAFLVIAAVYASFKVQQQNEKIQQQVTQIQQNIRAAMDMMSREFVIAAYDPFNTGNYGLVNDVVYVDDDGVSSTFTTGSTTFVFSGDLCEESDSPNLPNDPGDNCRSTSPWAGQYLNETYIYDHYDSDGDGYLDAINRIPGNHSIAENIDRIEFRYLLNDGTYKLTPTASEIEQIVAVRVSILARSDQPDYKYTDNNTYSTTFTDMDGTVIAGTTWNPLTFAYPNNLNYRRRMLAKTIYLRNVGLL